MPRFPSLIPAILPVPSNSSPQTITAETEAVSLPAPPVEYSLNPDRPQPYSEYTLTITAPGFDPFQVSGVEVLPLITSLYQARLRPRTRPAEESLYVIGPHTLYGDYPPKIAETEIKPVQESGEIVLSRVVVPETIVVHDGPPTDRSRLGLLCIL